MKREEVYKFITDYSEGLMKAEELDPVLMKATRSVSKDTNKKIIDSVTGGVYKNRSNLTIEIIVGFVLCGIGIFLFPWSILTNAIVSLIPVMIFEFIYNKGFSFLYSDLCNLFQKECEIKYSHKLHYNKYEPVVFGYDKDSKLNVLSYSDDKISTLKDSKFYVADKETLGSFLKNYRNGIPQDLQTISYKIVRNLEETYGKVSLANSFDYTDSVNKQIAEFKKKSVSKSNSLS